MDKRILHPFPAEREPDLYATDIPFSASGLSAGIVEVGDLESYRLVAREAILALARVTAQLDRANVIITMLRTELRARRAA